MSKYNSEWLDLEFKQENMILIVDDEELVSGTYQDFLELDHIQLLRI